MTRIQLILTFVVAFTPAARGQQDAWSLDSPDGKASINFSLDEGTAVYSVTFDGESIILPSRLGLVFAEGEPLDGPFRVVNVAKTVIDESWKPVWGQQSTIQNHANQMEIELAETEGAHRQLTLVFRAYDDGVAFRYHLPEQAHLSEFELVDELTTFHFSGDHTTWWLEDLWNTYEREYRETPLSEAIQEGMNTPVTMRTQSGKYLSVHEADLTDWSGMTLNHSATAEPLAMEAALVPWYESNVKVKGKTPHSSPWRTIQLSASPGELIESSLILNLNDPCAIEDTSWIEPAKFMGIWWGCITGVWNWELEADPNKHGATTARAMRYIDACARHEIPCLLIEGWCEGWEGDWGDMNMLKPYSDFDIKKVTDHARAKGVTLIGHHETGGNITNYEQQWPAAFEFYQQFGINRIKTGYVTYDQPVFCEGMTTKGREHHHGQFMVNHYQRVVELAARYRIMIDAHEPIKPTGISRTWPNFVAREGARGGEWNHFAGNAPSQVCILPFTRLLGGPMDYTPGLFDCAYNGMHTQKTRFSTRAHQLALYVTLWSPLQMAADFYQAYEGEAATQFIRNVPVGKWDETIVPLAEIGDYLVTARRHGQNWFIGATTNEESRSLQLPLSFLNEGTTYHAVIYSDGEGADYVDNPYPVNISESLLTHSDSLTLKLAKGGGAAVELYPEGTEFTRPSGKAGKIKPHARYRLRAKHSGRLLSLDDSSVIQSGENPTLGQQWMLAPAGNGLYQLTIGSRTLTSRGNENGAPVTVESPQSDAAQRWRFEHIVGSWYRIFNSASNKVLDVAEISYSDGARLHTWEWSQGANQIWALELVPE
jgi:alpha-glucosidase